MNDIKTIYNAISNKTANQDYIRVFAPQGRAPKNDANVFATLAKAAENGTIFDVIFGDMADGKPDYQYRVLSYLKSDSFVVYCTDSGIENIQIVGTPDQYQALSIIQRGVDAVAGDVQDFLPKLAITNGFLDEGVSGTTIATPEGYRLEATAENGILATLSVSSEKVQEGILYCQITFEDALNLIGLPCTTA